MLQTRKSATTTPLAPKSNMTNRPDLSAAPKPPLPPVSSATAGDTPHCNYRDCSRDPIEDLSDPAAFLNAASSAKDSPFPVKLHRILCNPDYRDIIAWLPHGKSWRVLKPKAFEEKVIPAYFRHCRYSSFMRQVNGWGFKRIYQGADLNSYYHELFHKDLPYLCLRMRRPQSKHSKQIAQDAAKTRAPDFYALSEKNPLPSFPSGFQASSEDGDDVSSKLCSQPTQDPTAKKNSADQSKWERNPPLQQGDDLNYPSAPRGTSNPALEPQATDAENQIKNRVLKLGVQQKKPQHSAVAPANDALAAVLRQHQLQNPLVQLQLQEQANIHCLQAQSQQQLLNIPYVLRPTISENEAANLERIQQTLLVPKLQNLLLNNARTGPMQQTPNVNVGQLQLQEYLAGNWGLAAPSMTSPQQLQEQDLLKLLQLKKMQQRNIFF